MALTEAQAEEDFYAARQRLRDTLVRIQTYRIDAMLRRDVPDVASEVAWLLAQGRFNLVTLLMEQVERYIDATPTSNSRNRKGRGNTKRS